MIPMNGRSVEERKEGHYKKWKNETMKNWKEGRKDENDKLKEEKREREKLISRKRIIWNSLDISKTVLDNIWELIVLFLRKIFDGIFNI